MGNSSEAGSLRRGLYLSLAIAALWLVIRLLLLRSTGFPDPKVHDEFAYLLSGDTFAHGRLTNPPHPLASFFASPHFLISPTYSSKYPPGQGLFLAVGQVVFGHPFYGVVMGGALMIFLLCLMLCFWTTLWAAAIVSVSLVLFFQPPMYWVDSYWGGCLAAAGSALLLVAVGWYRRAARPEAGCLFAAGGVLLFVTRPYEGAAMVLASLLIFILGAPRSHKRTLLRAAMYAAPVAIAGGAGVAAHNHAVTGNPLQLPYLLHVKTYMVAPILSFQTFRESDPEYPHPRVAAQHGRNGWEANVAREDLRAMQHGYAGRLFTSARFVFAFLPQLPLLLFGRSFVDRRVWISLALIGAGIFDISFELFRYEHYLAPVVPGIVLLWGLLAERTLAVRTGTVPTGLIVACGVFLAAMSPSIGSTLRERSAARARLLEWPHERTEMIRNLSARGKPSVVLVHYPYPSWNIGVEWVYNGADIDHQPVIFAHDLGTDRNSELLNYYPDRKAWLLTFDPDNPDKYFLNTYPR